MNNNAWFIKEKPLLSLQSMGGGAAGSLMQGAADKSYIDDVFSTYLYDGNDSTQVITNGIDISGEGGLVWCKPRSVGYNHSLFDTARGYVKVLQSNTDAISDTRVNGLNSFNSDGFTLGSDANANNSGQTFASWTFRKAPGFFDIVTWTGNGGGNRAINHDLGSVPGVIMLKRTDGVASWFTYHRSLSTDASKFLYLNSTNSVQDSDGVFGDTAPTSTQFTAGWESGNTNGHTYIAYLFAGGPAANTEHSVGFDGTGDYLSIDGGTDFDFGTGDFTVEGWFKKDDTSQGGFFQFSTASGGLDGGSAPAAAWTGSDWQVYGGSPSAPTSTTPALKTNTWFHLALVRHSTSLYLYVDGVLATSTTNSDGVGGASDLAIGGYYNTNFLHVGKISNFRVVKGTAVYTSAFRPEHKALENISGTVLLCCNQSTTTGSTITPGTIIENGNPIVSTDNPDFIDPESYKFGEDEDKNVISCGNYTGNGSATGPEINLGWEPSWLLIKSATENGENWATFDSMRGIVSGGDDKYLYANSSGTENTYDLIELTPTGFKCVRDDGTTNRSGETFIYCAIRMPDGYVGKPPSAGTGVFAMDTGNSNTDIPNFDSGFPVDFAWAKLTGSTGNWWTSARLIQGREIKTNINDAEGAGTNKVFDSNAGWHDTNGTSGYISHMWKRHAGFDVVTYKGDGQAGRQVPHSLNAVPGMIWVKRRDLSKNWAIYHNGLNGGTNPEQYSLILNNTGSQDDETNLWNDTAPTSSVFTVGNGGSEPGDRVNTSSGTYIAMLFSSVTGISKVGYYTGTGSAGLSITTGFQPRFVFIKRTDSSSNWNVFDSLRGMSSGSTLGLYLNETDSNQSIDWCNATSTGFDVPTTNVNVNASSGKYIYYAHA